MAKSERGEYERSTDLSLIGLTQQDIDDRGILVLGYTRGELLPPYEGNTHTQRAEAILHYVQTLSNPVAYDQLGYPEDISLEDTWPGKKVIEVVGSYPLWCVAKGIEHIVTNGKYAMVQSAQLLSQNPEQQDFTIGRTLISDLLSHPRTNCLIFGREKFIFYPSTRRISN